MIDKAPVYEYELEVTEIDPVPSSRGDYCFEATVSRLERLHAGIRETVESPKHLFWGKSATKGNDVWRLLKLIGVKGPSAVSMLAL